MRKSLAVMAAMAATVMSAQAAHANVTCEPGSCTNDADGTAAPLANFTVTPSGIDASYRGPITASIGNTVNAPSGSFIDFTDTFEFFLPESGTGSGSAINNVGLKAIGKNTDIDFTDIIINGVSGVASGLFDVVNLNTAAGGLSYVAATVGVNSGFNSIQIKGRAYGSASYGGTINFTPAVPELATWGMMILGFIGVGAAMRRRRNTTVTFGNKRPVAA